ncbi:MAG: 50S ribosomal protein L35 [bacterium]|nr:50S ribosomal protein L35 [bacterium]MDO5462890.1 50S ribosomal protein L35 [bacterium]
MPKIKTKKSATKKFKMSATGKAMRTQAGKRHLNGYKSRGRKRALRGSTSVYEGNQKMVARMLQA